ncbi:MAG: thioredoxin family protein [Chitinispirillaceae bacterium]|nr:thioredoxin family protein [Chitinispirillaceae bacterium]
MKYALFTSLTILTIAVLSCMEGPAVVNPGDEHINKPEKAVTVGSSTIDSVLAGDSTLAIVEFYSEICGVCGSLRWVIDSLAVTFGDTVVVGANCIETDSLWKRYSVTSVPTYILFRAGEETARCSFSENEPQVYDSLASLIRQLIEGTFVPDTGDTDTIVDTIPPNYLQLDESSFDTTVLRKGVTALVFFLAPAGAPCIAMESVMWDIAPRFDGRAVIAKVHAWETPALCDRYGINFVPQFFFFKDSIHREEYHLTGIVPGDTLIAHLEALLAEVPDNAPVLLNSDTFGDSVTTDGRVVMVDFFSSSCSYCSAMNPIVDALSDSIGTEVLIAKVHVPENDSLSFALNITQLPTFVFFNNGVEYERKIGLFTIDQLAEVIHVGLDAVTD